MTKNVFFWANIFFCKGSSLLTHGRNLIWLLLLLLLGQLTLRVFFRENSLKICCRRSENVKFLTGKPSLRKKYPVFGVFLVLIFSHSDSVRMREKTAKCNVKQRILLHVIPVVLYSFMLTINKENLHLEI